jgi:hypothetical protein
MICGRHACGSGSSRSRTWCTCGTRRPHRCARIRAASSIGCSRLRQTRTGMGRTMRRGRTWTPERRGSYYTAVVTIFTRVAFRTPPGLRALQRKTEFFAKYSFLRVGWVLVLFSLSPDLRSRPTLVGSVDSATARESLGTESESLSIFHSFGLLSHAKLSKTSIDQTRRNAPALWGVTATSCSSSRISPFTIRLRQLR